MEISKRFVKRLKGLRDSRIGALLRRIDDALYERIGPLRILFVLSTPNGFYSALPVIEALKQEPAVQIGLLMTVGGRMPPTAEFNAVWKKYGVSRVWASLSKWHYVIYPHLCDKWFLRDSTHTFLNHGTGFGIETDSIKRAASPQFRLYFGFSEAELSYLRNAAPPLFADGSRLFFPVGFPKGDALIQGRFSREQTLSNLGLPTNRKTILISSHWCPQSLLGAWGAEVAHRLLREASEYNVIQIAHEGFWIRIHAEDSPTQSLALEELESLQRRHPHFRVLQDENEMPYLNAADLLMADHSSILIEFTLLDRPILFFDNPQFSFFDPQVHQMYREGADSFTDLEGLAEKCRHALGHPERHRIGRLRLKKAFLPYAGEAAQRVVRVLLTLGRMCGPQSARWAKAVELSRCLQGRDWV